MKRYTYFKMRFYAIALAVLGILIFLSACDKLIEIDVPIDKLTTQQVFADSASAEAVVAGLYSQVAYGTSSSFLQDLISLCPALSADELLRTDGYADYEEFMANTILVNNVENYTIWRTAYSQLYHVNSLLEQLELTKAVSEARRTQLMGETRFLRALHYFYLTNLYGAVPLALGTDYRVNASLQRSSPEVVYEQIVNDLSYAESTLGPSYPSTKRVRVNQWAAAALLARVQLYRGELESAIRHASAVIGSGMYSLEPIADVFKASSQEAILQFSPPATNLTNAIEGARFIPASGTVIPTYQLTTQLLSAFDENDRRKQVWLSENIIGGVSYVYPYKYKVRSGVNNTDKTEFSIPFRLAEQYLIRAEALAQQGRVDEAIADIDKIRGRAGLTIFAETRPAIGQSALLDAIQQERQVELFTEWGHRWFDLKRTGRAEAVLSPIKPGFTTGALLYPIPELDRLQNPFLDQNLGYD